MPRRFFKGVSGLAGFRREAHFSTWLYRMTVNMTYDFLRRRRKIVSNDGVIEQYPAKNADPQQALTDKEQALMLDEALRQVPLQYRTALILKDIEGFSYAEIAGILRCRIGTVESKIYRARQSLRQNLRRLETEAIL